MIQIFATDNKGNREEITDLYWFEENFVHDFDGDGFDMKYKFEIFIDGVQVYPQKSAGDLLSSNKKNSQT